MKQLVQSGLDIFFKSDFRRFRGQRIGLLIHQASVNSSLEHAISLFQKNHLNVTTHFAPEHGLWGSAQDQIPVQSEKGVISLYGDNRYPSEDQLCHIDVLICDLQDVGSRYYTFIWTMALAMQACAKYGKKFVVLDRPNPINGITLEGPTLDMNFSSFVGLYPVPVRHGMTIGEIALWINSTFDIHADLEVIRMKGWKRSMYFNETGLPWVLPSPNMPTLDTAIVYPGGCLLEATNLSEGRGTTRPFELFGASYIQPEKLEQALHKKKLPGAIIRPCYFEPTFHKFQKELCGGIQLHVTDRTIFRSFEAYCVILQTIHDLYPNQFQWRQPPYEYELTLLPIDILCGTDTVRLAIESGKDVRSLRTQWKADVHTFSRARKDFLLYN